MELDSEATDADREAAAARAAAERAEADKRERRKVLTLNKLGAAAIGVRRAFVTALVARKTPPKGSAQFIASCLARDSFMLTHHQVDDVAAELLGAQGGRDGLRTLIDGLPANGEGRAQVISLALVLAALEVKTTKEAWRSPAPLADDSHNAGRYYRLGGVSTGDYLRWLAGHEYALSEVEQVVTGQRSADDVFDGLTGQQ